jgi:hypothetical protein
MQKYIIHNSGDDISERFKFYPYSKVLYRNTDIYVSILFRNLSRILFHKWDI